jgi:hypothetical protein
LAPVKQRSSSNGIPAATESYHELPEHDIAESKMKTTRTFHRVVSLAGSIGGRVQGTQTFNFFPAACGGARKPKNVSPLFRNLIFLAALARIAVECRAADQDVRIEHALSAGPLEAPAGEAFLDRFNVAFNQRVNDVFVDRFHPFRVMNWSLELAQGDSDHLRERAASGARNAVAKSMVYGLREATVDLPLLKWLEERQGLIGDFLLNSVGNVGEEAVAPLDVSYRPVGRSWWDRLSERGGELHYGIRPFSPSPYAFLTLGIKDGDDLLFLGHLRYHYRAFAEHLVELAFSVPLAHGLAVDLGASYQMGPQGAEERLTVKFFKQFKSGGILHVGMEVREHPACFAGIALPW